MLYKKGKVYRIICLPEPNIQYVGCTFNELRFRMYNHKARYKDWLKGNKNGYCSIYDAFKQYGFNNFKIVLIKEYTVCAEHNKDKNHLKVYEQLWISKLKCVNIANSFYIKFITFEQKERKNTVHINKTPEELKEQQKGYYRKNKKKKLLQAKEYRNNNKETIKQKEKEKITCICGSIISRRNLGRHMKTPKHISLLNMM